MSAWRLAAPVAHVLAVLALTLLTQLGGIAWLVALGVRRRLPALPVFVPVFVPVFGLAFLLAYAALWGAALVTAPLFGREALPCTGAGPLRVASPLYCAMNRAYVTPELGAVLADLAEAVTAEHPGTETLVLDAGFPFVTGFPLLPHLSHDDGEKADLAFYYRDAEGYVPGALRSPIGYFAFEPGPDDCPAAWPTLRWDMAWAQGFWRELEPEPARMRAALRWLAREERVGRVFLEPRLAARFGVSSPKIRFQGCRAARHDDHIHLQL